MEMLAGSDVFHRLADINAVFDDEGKFRDVEFPKVPGPAKKNCKFCEFGNRGICDKKATK